MAALTIVDAEVKGDDVDGTTTRGMAGELILPGQPVYYDDDEDIWYLSYSAGMSTEADVGGISLGRATAGQRFRIQTDGRPTLGASAGIVVGRFYALGSVPGTTVPVADLKVTDYRTGLGIGRANGVLALHILSTGILPGPALNESLKKWVMAPRVTDNTPQVGVIIDRNGYNEVTFHFNIGTIADADATFTPILEGGNIANLSDAAAVADADMVSQTIGVAPEVAASWNSGDDGEVRKLGYKDDTAPYRYLRMTVNPALNAGDADFSCFCVLGAPPSTPVVQTAS